MTSGFIMISRRMFRHFLWEEDRAFSRAEAWLDMIQFAAFAPTKRLVDGQKLDVPRGGIVASERFLSNRWKWSRTKVRAFLDVLDSEHMIKREKNQGNTVILLCRYDDFNTLEKPQVRPPEDQSETKVEEGECSKAKERAQAAAPKSAAEVAAYGQTLVPPAAADFCAAWFEEMDGRGWSDRYGQPVLKWKMTFSAAHKNARHSETERNKRYGANQRTARGGINRNTGTLNEPLTSQYGTD